jgi:hypothetical protein
MARFVLDNLTIEQAKILAMWFSGQGEQDCSYWFEEQNVRAPSVNIQNPKWLTVSEDTITVDCTPRKSS